MKKDNDKKRGDETRYYTDDEITLQLKEAINEFLIEEFGKSLEMLKLEIEIKKILENESEN